MLVRSVLHGREVIEICNTAAHAPYTNLSLGFGIWYATADAVCHRLVQKIIRS
jgi:hypothetical protein